MMADSIQVPPDAEPLLIALMRDEGRIEAAREHLEKRRTEIGNLVHEEFSAGIKAAPSDEAYEDVFDAAVRRLIDLEHGKYRSELATLVADIVRRERRRAETLRKLEAFPQLGPLPPAVDIAIDFDGERRLTITAGGQAHSITLPHVIDRGVWREETRYERGDAVTLDGALWIARRDDPAHRPGAGDAWRLAVSRGKNGRDGRDATGARPRGAA